MAAAFSGIDLSSVGPGSLGKRPREEEEEDEVDALRLPNDEEMVANVMSNLPMMPTAGNPPFNFDGAMGGPMAMGAMMGGFDPGQQQALMQEAQQRAMASAAAMTGISEEAAKAMLAQMTDSGLGEAGALLAGMPDSLGACGSVLGQPGMAPEDEGEGELEGAGFTCPVCRQVFKREVNLSYHMTAHQPANLLVAEAGEGTLVPGDPDEGEGDENGHVLCKHCNKKFATKYQCKKHYLRRHFNGQKQFPCLKCNKKSFAVREDLTMHMKSCGNVYICTCGIKLCSLGALKRHCKHFNHEALSFKSQPDPSKQEEAGLLAMSEPTALLAPPPQVAHVPKVVQAREVVRHPPVTASAVSGAGGSGGGGNSAMACANLGAGAGMGAAPGAAVAAGMGIGVGPGMALNLCSQAALHVVPCRVEGQELPPPYPAPNWGGAYGGGGGAGVAPTGFGHSPGGLPPASTAAAATAAIAVASPAPNAQYLAQSAQRELAEQLVGHGADPAALSAAVSAAYAPSQ